MEYRLINGPQFDLCPSAKPGPFNFRDDVWWDDGHDVAIAKSNILEWTPPASGVFEFARPEFKYEVGQKVGMIVGTSSLQMNDFSVRAPGLATKYLVSIYGQMDGRTHLYTGTVTHVGKEHIEYDINTMAGFSGAMIFLLDKKQPSSVKEEDYGKVIAVHVGSPKILWGDANIGFRSSVEGKSIFHESTNHNIVDAGF